MKEIFYFCLFMLILLLIGKSCKNEPLFTHECTYEVFQNNKVINNNHKIEVPFASRCYSHNAFFTDVYYKLKSVEALPEFIEYQKTKEQ